MQMLRSFTKYAKLYIPIKYIPIKTVRSDTIADSETITMKRTTYVKMIAVAFLMVGFLAGFVTNWFIGGSPASKAPPTLSGTGTVSIPTTSIPGGSSGSGGGNSASSGSTNLAIPSYAPFRGSNSSTINFVEFGDYQCPFCERFFQQSEPQVMQNYTNTGKIKFYFLDFQFLGPDSQTLGQGAWCASDQGKYYEYHDYMYSHQGTENSGWATADKVKALATNIAGLNAQQFNSCLDSQKYQSRVQNLTQLGQSSGVSGTPTFFIGNSKKGYVQITGAQPYYAIQQNIDKQLSAA
ncbi:MAG: DsbA family protein [Candidatus Micrarchaeota archaeon]|nr:DsbA family protein [Candidatus Micrarchaeota archaeon]